MALFNGQTSKIDDTDCVSKKFGKPSKTLANQPQSRSSMLLDQQLGCLAFKGV